MSADIVPLRVAFDPTSVDAEARYDGVVHRINRLIAAASRARSRAGEIERQFVENDLVFASGPRRGQALTARGRRRRLTELLALHVELAQIGAERGRLEALLQQMNDALDAWARRTYGLGGLGGLGGLDGAPRAREDDRPPAATP